jgi:predicted nucleic acid-binding protein
MILIEANLFLYAYDARASQHAAALKWLQQTFSASEPVRLPWVVVLAFLG